MHQFALFWRVMYLFAIGEMELFFKQLQKKYTFAKVKWESQIGQRNKSYEILRNSYSLRMLQRR